MSTRIVPLILLLLLLLVLAQLLSGRGSVEHVSNLRAQIAEQKAANDKARKENDRLSAEVSDLKEGMDMVEEKARSELGMVKPNEIYVHVAPARQ
ncbi:septum formation initiator family protein [Diaphorobacter sp.]|uniref:septum formation initiator family protein n=1 Tax=Diaphorobacter sp. TaxID=1934310 RepID=UPI0028B1AC96|nr:septum formation initiator family protein [Diaphorobacter sp.]